MFQGKMLHLPSPTVPVPTAAAALSPAPAIIFTFSESPSSAATSGFRLPTTRNFHKVSEAVLLLRRRCPSFFGPAFVFYIHQKHADASE